MPRLDLRDLLSTHENPPLPQQWLHQWLARTLETWSFEHSLHTVRERQFFDSSTAMTFQEMTRSYCCGCVDNPSSHFLADLSTNVRAKVDLWWVCGALRVASEHCLV